MTGQCSLHLYDALMACRLDRCRYSHQQQASQPCKALGAGSSVCWLAESEGHQVSTQTWHSSPLLYEEAAAINLSNVHDAHSWLLFHTNVSQSPSVSGFAVLHRTSPAGWLLVLYIDFQRKRDWQNVASSSAREAMVSWCSVSPACVEHQHTGLAAI